MRTVGEIIKDHLQRDGDSADWFDERAVDEYAEREEQEVEDRGSDE